MIVLDTNVVSEIMGPNPESRVGQWVDERRLGDLAITSTIVAELLYGVARLPEGARRSDLEATARVIVHEEFRGRVLPFDIVAAEHYADLAAERDRSGRPLGVADGQIAAVCRRHRATLATRNVRDFEGTGIELVDPWAAG